MKSTQMLSKIKEVLGIEVELEQAKLDNGTVLEAEAFEKDNEVFIVTEDEKVAVPKGKYQMEDGKILVVREEGLIAEIMQEDEDEEEVEAEIEMEDIEVEAEDQEEEEKDKEKMGYATKEELGEVKKMVEEIKAMIENKQDMSLEEETQAEEVTEELPEEVKEELSAPAAEPIKHSPENTTEKKEVVRFAQKRPKSILDTVFEKLNNN